MKSIKESYLMMFDIDFICDNFIIPLLRYPILVYLPLSVSLHNWFCKFGPRRSTLTLIFLSLTFLINLLIYVNRYYRRHYNGRHWNTLYEKNFVIVITGGSNGLGYTILCELYKKYSGSKTNFKIINVDKSDFTDTELLAKSQIEFIQFNFDSNEGEINKLCTEIKKKHGPVDVLVNNAGMRDHFKNLSQQSMSEVQQIFQVNVFSAIQMMNDLNPKFVVNVASVLGLIAPANLASYAATKAALVAFHESWINERSSHGVLVLPGQLKNTDMFKAIDPPKQFFAPLVDCEKLSLKIIDKIEHCESGEIYLPLYANFIPLLRIMPFAVGKFMRWFSGVDTCIEL